MRMIMTHEGYMLNSELLLTVQSVLIDRKSYAVLEISNDETDYEIIEFGILATTASGEEFILAVYETEEERDYARYKLENWLTSEFSNLHKMPERK